MIPRYPAHAVYYCLPFKRGVLLALVIKFQEFGPLMFMLDLFVRMFPNTRSVLWCPKPWTIDSKILAGHYHY